MNPQHDPMPTRSAALKIAMVYAVVGVLWILGSGRLLHYFVHDKLQAAAIENVKGWFYVLVTATLLGWWLNRVFCQIRTASALLRKSEERMRFALENCHIGAWDMNPTDHTAFRSEEHARIFGYVQPLPPWNREKFLEHVMPEERARVSDAIQRGIDAKCNFSFECRIRRTDGGVRWIWVAGRPVVDESGQDRRVAGIVQDITARKQAEEERSSLEAQLQQAQKMESIGRLAGSVAHDYNNLLLGIIGYAELAREAVDGDHPVRPWLDEITACAQRSAAITRQLLAFARKQTISPVVLDLNDHVATTLKLLRRLIREDIQLTWHPRAREARVKMDPSQIDQILTNLAVNARDAIVGVGTLTFETGLSVFDAEYCARHAGTVPGDYVVLTVSDSGCGMDRATMEHIFEPFFTTKAPEKGTGLGLATVYGIVQQNRGFLDVSSESGKGTTFKIYLPRLS